MVWEEGLADRVVQWGQAWLWRGQSCPSFRSCGLRGQVTPSSQTLAVCSLEMSAE